MGDELKILDAEKEATGTFKFDVEQMALFGEFNGNFYVLEGRAFDPSVM